MGLTDRRFFLKVAAGGVGSALLSSHLPLWSLAQAAPAEFATHDFIEVCSVLLGIGPKILKPDLDQDGFSIGDVYYSVAQKANPNGVATLVNAYNELKVQGKTSQEIADLLLLTPVATPRQDEVGSFARLSILMWLYGSWNGGTEIGHVSLAKSWIAADEYQRDFVVSGRAYKDGWIWRIAQAHPMGFSQFNFGSWADDPPTLADYGIQLA